MKLFLLADSQFNNRKEPFFSVTLTGFKFIGLTAGVYVV